MNEREYIRLMRQIRADFHKKIEALDTVWRLSNSGPPPTSPKKKKRNEQAPAGSRGSVINAVREAVEAMHERFSTKDVEWWIRDNRSDVTADRSSISHSIKRMPEITLIEQGRGKRPSLFRKVVENLDKFTSAMEPQVGVCRATNDQVEEIRRLAQENNLQRDRFVAEIMTGKYGVQRLADLTHQQAVELIDLLESGWGREEPQVQETAN